jgi:hypothetical protein
MKTELHEFFTSPQDDGSGQLANPASLSPAFAGNRIETFPFVAIHNIM